MAMKNSKYHSRNNGHNRKVLHKRRIRQFMVLFGLAILSGIIALLAINTKTVILSTKDIPSSLIELAKRQPEAFSFVQAYPERSDTEDVDLSAEFDGQSVTLLLQWDKRWGYAQYGDDFLAITGCGPTCLSMVYIYLTGDTSMHPGEMARWADREGYYITGTGTSWSLMDLGAEELGLNVYTTSLSSEHITSALSSGDIIICSVGPGDFTREGHFIVLAGIDDDGKILVRDPNSKKRSDKKWELDQIIPQIKQYWIYS